MNSTIRRALVLAATPALVMTLATSARAAAVEPDAVLGLTTSASFGGASLTIVAEGSFYGGIVANSTVAVQAAGVETWTDSRGIIRTMPVACHGEALRFASTNTVYCTIALNSADSTVSVQWTAEAVGAAPTPFVGTCAGTANRTLGTEIVIPTC